MTIQTLVLHHLPGSSLCYVARQVSRGELRITCFNNVSLWRDQVVATAQRAALACTDLLTVQARALSSVSRAVTWSRPAILPVR